MPKLLLNLTSCAALCLAVSSTPITSPLATPQIYPATTSQSARACPWLDPTCEDGVHRG
jgi:hypothetical protein